MTQRFLPEGRLRFTKENQELCATREGLRRAMEEGTILEGVAFLCDARHDLLVRFGPFTGTIPRTEAALGIAEGRTKEAAILSRVGKPTCFTVNSLEDNTIILSRRRAQELALHDMTSAWRQGDVISVTVTHPESFGVFVDVGCGLPSLITLEQISVSRISHSNLRFSPGDELKAVVTGLDPIQGRVYLSHKALLGTWAENAALFSAGITITGVVRAVKSYGVFVELSPNLSGLAEPCPGLREGDRVSVFLKAIQPERRKIKLVVIDRLLPDSEPVPIRYFFQGGHLESWRYSPDSPALW